MNKRKATKEEIREYDRNWYAEHPEYRKRQIRLKLDKRKTNKEWVWNYKAEKGCQLCGENDPCCLDFHHIKGEKDKNVADFIKGNWSLKRIKEEIAKCRVLCANCHRKVHHYGDTEIKCVCRKTHYIVDVTDSFSISDSVGCELEQRLWNLIIVKFKNPEKQKEMFKLVKEITLLMIPYASTTKDMVTCIKKFLDVFFD